MNWKNIIETLTNKGLTERDIAKACDTIQPNINRIKSGEMPEPRWTLGDNLIKLYKRYKRRKDR